VGTTETNADIYETLATLNRGFAAVLEALSQVEEAAVFDARPSLVPGIRLAVEEARAWANFELTAALRDRAEREWARSGRLRREWEEKK
jgi:hypothetical protein